MSLHDYQVASRLDAEGVPCAALILAAIRRADPTTRARLCRAFPEMRDELEKRAKEPDGRLPSERAWDELEEAR